MAADTRSARSVEFHHETIVEGEPPLAWDYKEGRFNLALRGISLKDTDDPQAGVILSYHPPVLYDMRIRKVGDTWGPGLILPVTNVGLSNLEPDTEYECRVTEVDLQGNRKPDAVVHLEKFRSPADSVTGSGP